ncbi:Calcium-binding protein NCS-1 [Glugoides intestinalis]
MGNQTSQPLSQNKEYAKFVQLLPGEVKDWFAVFKAMYPGTRISIDNFTSFFRMLFPFGKVEPFCKRLFQTINISKTKDIDLKELLLAFTILLKGSTFERVRWIFRFYDEDKDGAVSREELLSTLSLVNDLISNSLLTAIDQTQLADEIFNTLHNESGFLSLNDFETLAMSSEENLKKISFFS